MGWGCGFGGGGSVSQCEVVVVWVSACSGARGVGCRGEGWRLCFFERGLGVRGEIGWELCLWSGGVG